MTSQATDSRIETMLTTKENPFGERYIEAFNGTLFESTSAAAEFTRRFGTALFQENTLYVVVGSDAGLLPQFIIKRGLPRGSRYLFVEPDEVKEHLADDLIAAELADRLAISDASHWIDRANGLALLNYSYAGKISYASSCSAQHATHPAYPALTQSVTRDLRHLFWRDTALFDSHIFINCLLTNLAENRTPAILLKERFKGKSAIILGAGPSLDELIPWIKAHRHEVLLIAVSRISARLLQTALEPDIVISVDPQDVSFSVSKDMFNFGSSTLFVNVCHTTPLLLGQWPHRNLFTGPRLPWLEEDFDNIRTVAPTVTNNAILLAQELGCTQIILTGVDLCYSADGYTHAQGTLEHAAGPMIGRIEYTVKTNAGAEAETNKGYYEAIKVIAEQALEASARGCRLINPAAGAACVAGVEYIPVTEIVIPEPLDEPAWETITSLIDADSSEARCTHYNVMVKKLDKASHNLRWIRRLCVEALKCNTKMAAHLNLPEYSRYKIQMERIERILDIRFAALSNAVKRYNSNGFAKFISADSGDDWSTDELFEKTRTYYDEFITGATRLAEVIGETKKRLLSRLEEESTTPDFARMFNQWRQDRQYGRVKIWKNRQPEIYSNASPEIKKTTGTLLDQFNHLLAAAATNLQQNLQKLTADANTFGGIVENAMTSLAKGDKEALMRITRGLSKRSEPLAVQARLLIEGFIKELEQEYQAAKSIYHSIDAGISGDLKQIALERIVNYSMTREDYPTTLSALQQLSENIPSYKRLYARLLALTGSITESIAEYISYLQQQPRDLDTTLELGMLLAESGAVEAAESALDHIKETDSNHPGIEQLTALLQKN